MTKTEIGQTLKSARLAARLTQAEVAKRTGKSQQTVASWESGQSQPDMAMLLQICGFYGISVDETFGQRLQNETEIELANLRKQFVKLNKTGREYILKQIEFALTHKEYRITPDDEPRVRIYRAARSENHTEHEVILAPEGMIDHLKELPKVVKDSEL